MNELQVTFPSGDASIKLEGLIQFPDGEGPFPAAVVCHPYPPAGGTMEVPLIQAISRALGEIGLVALRFNFRSVGVSGGTFDDGRGEVDDVAGALDWLGAQPKVEPDRLGLVGYSFGAAMALFEAARNVRPQALALIGLPLGWDLPVPNIDERPCLLVAGERDQFCPAPELHSWARGSKGDVKIHIVAGADHFLFGYEGEVAAVVADFLRDRRWPS